MKILLLNPHFDATHKIVGLLKVRGMALLMPSNPEEAWQVLKLHGDSVDLAIIHREGVRGGDPGIEVLYKIKKDASQADLPVIFTSETWTADQCAAHQRTPMGANAYLSWPFDGNKLIATIDAVFGPEQAAAQASGVQAPGTPTTGEFVLEVPSFSNDTSQPTSIRLEAPGSGDSSPVISNGVSLELPSQTDASVSQIEIASPAEEPSGISIPIETVVKAPGASPAISPVVSEELHLEIASDTSLEVAESPEMTRVGKIPISPEVEIPESELAQEMPYLFNPQVNPPVKKSDPRIEIDPAAFSRAFAQPLGDAVVPGGAAQTPDSETLKKYLLLREQDVAALSSQLKAAREELTTVKSQLSAERSHSEGLQMLVEEQKRKIEDFEREKALALEGLHAEINELRFQTKSKSDKAKLLETQVHEATSEIERLKERVRSDIRKIRVRERELENKLEISKRDSEAILASREGKIIELKRKLDVLEFNMDLLQDRFTREKEAAAKLRDKLLKAAQVVRVAEGLLDSPSGSEPTKEKEKPEDTQAS